MSWEVAGGRCLHALPAQSVPLISRPPMMRLSTAALALLAACSSMPTTPTLTSRHFGTDSSGQPATLWTLSTGQMQIDVTDHGATLVAVRMPDRAGFLDDVALITDGRFSGGSHGFIVGHVVPEAQEGGPIALVRAGDVITIDDEAHEMTVEIDDAELTTRADAWTAPPFKATSGTLWKYIRLVENASNGCVTDG